MEFLPSLNTEAPKNLYPCLAQINIGPDGTTKSRRLSAGSFGSDGGNNGEGGGGNVLERVISGSRRKSMSGAGGGDSAADRKSSIAPGAGGGNEKGTWYWRVQAGVVGNQLVLLPLSNPPNPLLTHPPQPLSHAMPAHSTASHSIRAKGDNGDDDEGFVDKVKNFIRRGSKSDPEKKEKHDVASTTPAQTGGVDQIVDQTGAGEQLPSADANAIGATNVNANAELSWPGVLNGGEKLGAVVVSLGGVDKGKVNLGGGGKKEASWVTIHVTSHFGSMVQGMTENSGGSKSGSIRLEFDKEWIGAKAEAELIHHQITSALERQPEPASLQLGGGTTGA